MSHGTIPPGARVRVRHPSSVSRAEINQLKSVLLETMHASEVVTRINKPASEEAVVKIDDNILDLRDHQVLLGLIKDFHSSIDDKDIWNEVETRLKRYCEMIPKIRYSAEERKWSINKIKFDNIFGYGKDNEINFRFVIGCYWFIWKKSGWQKFFSWSVNIRSFQLF